MKNYSYVGISLVMLVFGIIFIPKIIDRIKDDEVVSSDRLNQQRTTSKKDTGDALSYIVIDGEKKKAPQFEFINQEGETISNEDYKGKVYLVEFFFTTCPTICPIMNKNLVEIQNEFENNNDFGIASFSIDPGHDTPEVLAEYAANYGIDHPNWNLMTGNRDGIYKLANKGFGLYAGEDAQAAGGFAHQGMFALVDQQGYIRSRKDQFGNPVIYYRGSVERNKSVVEGEEEPQIDILIEDIKKLL
ncbi:SCO family protein [Christiangramia forsetii]|uniref:SCO1/SenC family electron transport protein n=2 Tax=Christiangramia forsetii TaxID=411153 RepID=A0LXT6_CHRFK|nr:SCO family protein [Christiangramia forsetii]GGG35932.1 photosynthetic protein synthase II [Christiangramia forsetii]CAL65181.1 SCO1/SenC family electron transport protein [Christiangramia forsetii KT0803]